MMYTPVIFFDIGTTLITGPTLTPAQQIAKTLRLNDETQHQLERQLLTSIIETPAALMALLIGTYAVAETTAADLAATIWKSQSEKIKIVPGGIEILSQLRAKKIRYGFISNIWFPYATTFTRLYGALAETNLTFFSFRLGLRKPDLSFFQKAITSAGLNPQRCVMLGDSYRNDIHPAIALGMKTVWFLCRPEKERVSLEKIRQNALSAPHKIVPSLVGLDIAKIVVDLLRET